MSTVSLRKLAHGNSAALATPVKSNSSTPSTSAATTPALSRTAGTPAMSPLTTPNGVEASPHTPRKRMSIALQYSPAATPSKASSVPFDWEAARGLKSPPYGSPNGKLKPRKSAANGRAPGTPVRKAIIRRKGWWQKARTLPDRIAFEISVFPNNVPMPRPETTAQIIGGTLHFIQFCIRCMQTREVPDSDLGWEDMYREGEERPWFDWTVPLTFLLLTAAFGNALYLFTRVRLYRMYHQPDLVASPNAKIVTAQLDFTPLKPPPMSVQLWRANASCWRWLLGLKPKTYIDAADPNRSRVQELEVWSPGEMELMLFCVYSPIHPFLWMVTNLSNWVMMFLIMGGIGLQSYVLVRSFALMQKDRAIISAEVMHEYNEGFVYPRINPVRRDKAVMTHQQEMVDA
ncbi:hypothetical protein FISHEDRAFT_38231 [Fistulina hepatica ATCC 64428]|nr:hypothetical protein FISHEDRAFT_38231 [Fistulina hepatica ATCC 64428]